MSVLGIDLGFGFTKATDGKNNLIFKSVTGEATDQRFTAGIPGLDAPAADEDTGGDHLHLEMDSGSIFVGELAERQSNLRSFTLDQGRYIEDAALPLTLAACAKLHDLNQPINIVTGLPVADYQDKAERLGKLLRGRHAITLNEGAGRAMRGTVVIDEVQVIPEPLGTVYQQTLNDNGSVADKNLAREKIAVIDVGFQTAEFTISDRGSFLDRASRSTDSGIARAFGVIAAKLREKSGVSLELYRLYDAVEDGRVAIRGSDYDLSKLTDHVFSQLADNVAAEANELWAEEWDIDRIVISGGGGKVLAPYLDSLLKGRTETIDVSGDPRMTNAVGFFRYGTYLWGGANAEQAATTVVEPDEDNSSTSEASSGEANGTKAAAGQAAAG